MAYSVETPFLYRSMAKRLARVSQRSSGMAMR
jgi:serine/threonine protein kinase